MFTNRFYLQKSVLNTLLLATVVTTLLSISSCGSSEVKPLAISDNCITISRSQISTNMLAGSWSVAGSDDFIPYIYFTPSKTASGISVTADPTDKSNILYPSRIVNLSIAAIDPPCSFPAGLEIHQSRYDFSTQGFADARGKLIPFDFLRLVPRASTEPGYETSMVFDVYMVTVASGVETSVAKGYTKPCPPFCPTH
jgi:hypothetical protein